MAPSGCEPDCAPPQILKPSQVTYISEDEGVLVAHKDMRLGRTGSNRGVSVVRRILVQFDTATLAADPVAAARLSIQMVQAKREEVIGVAVHRITTAWDQAEATYARATATADWEAFGGDFVSEPSAVASTADASCNRFPCNRAFDGEGMRSDVEMWLDGSAPNHGWILVATEEQQEKTAMLFSKESVELKVAFGGAALTATDDQPEAQPTSVGWRLSIDPGLALTAVVVGYILLHGVLRLCWMALKALRVCCCRPAVRVRLPTYTKETYTTYWSRISKNHNTFLATTGRVLSRRVPFLFSSIAQCLCMAGYVGLNVAAMIVAATGDGYEADLGYLAMGNMFLAVLWGTRNSLITLVIGKPFDRVIWLHRVCGRAVAVIISAHVVAYWVKWGRVEPTWENTKNLNGMVGWAALLIVFLTSTSFVRRNYYEVFKYCHFLFIVFFAFTYLHTPKVFLPYLIASSAAYGMDKALRSVAWFLSSKTTEITVMGDDMVRLRFPKTRFRRYTTGQYLMINFPEVDKINWHPYSISTGPRERQLEVHVRSLGGHTRAVLKRAKAMAAAGQPLRMKIDGPYGHPSGNPRRYPSHLYVAGGVGVTPIMGMLRDLYDISIEANVDGVKTCGDNVKRESVQMDSFRHSMAMLEEETRIDGLERPLPGTVYASHGGDAGLGASVSEAPHSRTSLPPPLPAKPPSSSRGMPCPPPKAQHPTKTTLSVQASVTSFDSFDADVPVEEPSIPPATETVTLVWCIKEAAHYQWFRDVFSDIKEKAATSLYPDFHLLVHVTRASKEDDLEEDLTAGRPDVRQICSNIARHASAHATMVFACGPDLMVKNAWDSASKYNDRSDTNHAFYFHRETFEW